MSRQDNRDGVHPPRQQRSRETMDRLLEATENLLAELPPEKLTVRGILREAGVSTGSFYARFSGIDSLLLALWEELTQSMDQFYQRLDARQTATWNLEQRVKWVVKQRVDRIVRYQGLMRAFTLLMATGRLEPRTEDRREYERSRLRLIAFLMESQEQITHPHPRKAIEMGEFAVAAAARSRLLFPEATHAATLRIRPRQLQQELARMFLAYLQSPDGATGL